MRSKAARAARNDGGAGIGLSSARNLNDYFALGAEITLAEFNYRASIAPGAGNAGAGFDTPATWKAWRCACTPPGTCSRAGDARSSPPPRA